ncbi:MAG: HEAT repeat domain-containing protein [Myxococcota bacterium]|nr:HEAT repeat domain-containing protein [Myxococcota bacterium]
MSGAVDWRRARDEALLVLEHSKKTEERIRAAEGLLGLADGFPDRWEELAPAIPRLIADRQEELRRGGVRLAALLLHPDEAEGFLGARLTDPSPRVRMEAAGQLADLARPSSRGVLAAALNDASYAVRFEAARGMAAVHHPAGLEVLVEALDNNDLRFRALGALGELADPRALGPVRTVFARWMMNPFERTQAAAVMARLGDSEGPRYLFERSKPVRFRRAPDRAMAVELLGDLRLPGAQQRLVELLETPGEPVRGAAARGYGRLSAPDAEERLAKLADEQGLPEDVLLDALEGLCQVSLPRAQTVADQVSARLSHIARTELSKMLRDFAAHEEEQVG